MPYIVQKSIVSGDVLLSSIVITMSHHFQDNAAKRQINGIQMISVWPFERF